MTTKPIAPIPPIQSHPFPEPRLLIISAAELHRWLATPGRKVSAAKAVFCLNCFLHHQNQNYRYN